MPLDMRVLFLQNKHLCLQLFQRLERLRNELSIAGVSKNKLIKFARQLGSEFHLQLLEVTV